MDEIIACLDGGGSKTALRWMDARGQSGQVRIERGCNPQDSSDWSDPIRAALAALPEAPARVTFGIPGFGEIPGLDPGVEAELGALMPGCLVLNDVALAYYGAFPDGGGTLVLSGTGSMAMARGKRGLVRVGGWGDLFGDEGSAFAIGRAALARASQAADGRRDGAGFATALSARLGVRPEDGPFGLMAWAHAHAQTSPRAAVAGVARHVDALAESGDAEARAILIAAARDLYRQARSAARLAGLPRPLVWCGAGSVLGSRTLSAALTGLAGAPPVAPAHSALAGGLILAARAAGWPEPAIRRIDLQGPS